MPMYWVVVYSAMPSEPPSRPRPDCLTPPKGAAALEMTPALKPDHAELDLLGHAQEPVEVAAVEVGGEAVFGGVGEPDGVFLGGEGGDGGDGAEDFLAQDRGVVGHVGEDGGLVEVAGPVHGCAAGDGGGPGVDGGTHQGVDVVAGAGVDQRARPGCRVRCRGRWSGRPWRRRTSG